MKKKRLITLSIITLFSISIQLVSVYGTPEDDKQVVLEKKVMNASESIVSINYDETLKN